MPVPAPTVVFDFDGTLIDSAPDLASTLNVILDDLRRPPVPVEEVRAMVGEGALALLKKGLEATGGADGLDPEAFRPRFLEIYEERLAEDTRLYPDALETLDVLAGRGCLVALCTNKPERMSRKILEAFGLQDQFAAVVGGDTYAVRKPDAGALTGAIDEAGGTLTHAVMVGDSMTDVRAARNAGVPVIAVSYGYTRIPVADFRADAVIDGLGELPGVLAARGLLT